MNKIIVAVIMVAVVAVGFLIYKGTKNNMNNAINNEIKTKDQMIQIMKKTADFLDTETTSKKMKMLMHMTDSMDVQTRLTVKTNDEIDQTAKQLSNSINDVIKDFTGSNGKWSFDINGDVGVFKMVVPSVDGKANDETKINFYRFSSDFWSSGQINDETKNDMKKITTKEQVIQIMKKTADFYDTASATDMRKQLLLSATSDDTRKKTESKTDEEIIKVGRQQSILTQGFMQEFSDSKGAWSFDINNNVGTLKYSLDDSLDNSTIMEFYNTQNLW